jgi:hypothetical protein
MTATEQELACLHADTLLLQQRLQLAAGLQEAAAKVTSKRNQLLASALKRDRQADIFGPCTQKEKRLGEAAVEAAGKLPSSNEVCISCIATCSVVRNKMLGLYKTAACTFNSLSVQCAHG